MPPLELNLSPQTLADVARRARDSGHESIEEYIVHIIERELREPALPITPAPIQLRYRAKPPLHRRRIWRRALLLISLVFMGLAAWRFGPAGYRHAQLLYFQRQCLNFQMPAGFVAFESNPTAAAKLIRQGTHYPIGAMGSSLSDGTTAWSRPPCAAFCPKCLDEFSEHGGDNNAVQGAFVYLHERISAGGKRYLVGVYLEVPMHGDHIILTHFAFAPATAFTDVVHVDGGSEVFYGMETWKDALTNRNVRFFGGQSDPKDPSQFSIDFEVAGKRDALDGRVQDNGAISFTQRGAGLGPT